MPRGYGKFRTLPPPSERKIPHMMTMAEIWREAQRNSGATYPLDDNQPVNFITTHRIDQNGALMPDDMENLRQVLEAARPVQRQTIRIATTPSGAPNPWMRWWRLAGEVT